MYLPEMTVVKDYDAMQPYLLLYQGLAGCGSLWQFDPCTATDCDWMNILSVLGSLDSVDGGGSTTVAGKYDDDKSTILGLNARFDFLSTHQETLMRWLPSGSSGGDGQTKNLVTSKERPSEHENGVVVCLTKKSHTSNGRDDLEVLHSLVATGGVDPKSMPTSGILELFPRTKELVDNDVDFGRAFRRYWRNVQQECDCGHHTTIECNFYSYAWYESQLIASWHPRLVLSDFNDSYLQVLRKNSTGACS